MNNRMARRAGFSLALSLAFSAMAFSAAALGLLLGSATAEAKCSIRVADSLITKRYQDCSPKVMLSYLYNDLVTPFSFTCAKKLSATCREENCDAPKTEEEKTRCWGSYVSILKSCEQDINDAARMARCKDTKVWPVQALSAPEEP